MGEDADRVFGRSVGGSETVCSKCGRILKKTEAKKRGGLDLCLACFKKGVASLARSRMFHLWGDRPIRRWNPVVGCGHHCYGDRCWAALTAGGRLRNNWRYADGFDRPKLVEGELGRRFGPGDIVFVVAMGDLFGRWVPRGWILRVIEAMERSPQALFFLETKNPIRYFEFMNELPDNVIFSATIETNRDYGLSKAPPPYSRYLAMLGISGHFRKHVSIEPIMDFDPEEMVYWMANIRPQAVSVGYDNYRCGLPEPPLGKTTELIAELERFTFVERKTLREAWDGGRG